MTRRALTVFLLSVGLAGLAACGKGAPSKADYLGKADPVCKRGNELAAVATTPTDMAGVKDFASKLADNVDKTTKELDELDTPGGEDGKAAEAMVKAMKDAAVALRAVGPDVDAANYTAIEDNGKKAADAMKNADAQARAFGSTECGKGEAEAAGRMQTAIGPAVKGAFITKVDELCATAQKQIKAIPVPEESPQALAGYFDKVLPIGDKLLADIKAIPAPRTDKEKFDTRIGAQELTVTKAKEVRAAAAANDEDKFETAFEASIRSSLDASGKAKAYGYKECGKTEA